MSAGEKELVAPGGEMMIEFIGRKLSRIILTILALSLALPLAIFIIIVAVHQARDIIAEMALFGDEIFYTVYGGIEYPMSVGDSDAVRRQLLQMSSKIANIQIYIADLNQKIIYATEADMIGKRMDDSIYDQAVWQDLITQPPPGEALKRSFEEKIEGRRYLNMVRLVKNQEKCHQCHGAEKEILGSMVVRMGTEKTYAKIIAHMRHYFFAALLGIIVIISISYLLLSWLVIKPVKRLSRNLQELPQQIDEGKYEARIVNRREDEIAAGAICQE